MIAELKRLFVGHPLATEQLAHERLSKRIALAVFASDALSSVAYATEAILIALIVAGEGALDYVIPIAIGIGLYLVKTLVEKNGGWVDVKAQPEGGTAFLLGLKEYARTNKHAE